MIQDDIVDDPPAAASKSGARARSALRQVRTRLVDVTPLASSCV
jgi:hypothetical protein